MKTQKSTKHYAYMLRCSDGTIYSGYSTDPDRRTAIHNRGRGAKYTRSRLPVELGFIECFPTKSEALKREAALKKLSHADKLALISSKGHNIQMDRTHFYITNKEIRIPAVLWGAPTSKLLIEVHGNFSNKEDTVISMMAGRAVQKGYQVLSFDLPMHGERANEAYACNPWNCISDLTAVFDYAKSLASDISLFACSLGAYFSLLAYPNFDIRQSLFLSPVVNMEHIIQNMMKGFQVSEERLRKERQIPLPIGQTLDWDYYSYVRNNPVCDWSIPTAVLYGSDDNMTEWNEITAFADKYKAAVQVLEHGEHYFHTEKQLQVFDTWADKNLL